MLLARRQPDRNLIAQIGYLEMVEQVFAGNPGSDLSGKFEVFPHRQI